MKSKEDNKVKSVFVENSSNLISINSKKPIKRKKDCDCSENGVECDHFKNDVTKFKKKIRYPKK